MSLSSLNFARTRNVSTSKACNEDPNLDIALNELARQSSHSCAESSRPSSPRPQNKKSLLKKKMSVGFSHKGSISPATPTSNAPAPIFQTHQAQIQSTTNSGNRASRASSSSMGSGNSHGYASNEDSGEERPKRPPKPISFRVTARKESEM